jgi:hypothetical protein
MGYQLPAWVWPAALMVVCALAIWRGRDNERLAAGMDLASWALTVVVFQDNSNATQWPVVMIDALLFAGLLWIALRSSRHWPMFAAGFALLLLVTHLASAADPSIGGWAYLTAGIMFSYLILAAIAYGAITAPRRYAEIEAQAEPTWRA